DSFRRVKAGWRSGSASEPCALCFCCFTWPTGPSGSAARGAGMRSRGLSVPQNRPHPDRQGLDFSQAGQGFSIELGFIQEEELGLRQERRQRIGKVMTELCKVLGLCHGHGHPDPLALWEGVRNPI